MLWYGDLVDFGSFETVLSRDSKSKAIYFSYEIDELQLEDRTLFVEAFGYFRRQGFQTTITGINYKVGIERRGERTRISSISIGIKSPPLQIELEVDDNNNVKRIDVNGNDLISAVTPLRINISAGTLFPELRFARAKEDLNKDIWGGNSANAVFPALSRLLRKVIDQRTRDKSIADISSRLIVSGLADRAKFRQIGAAQGKTVGRLFDSLASSPPGSTTYEQIALLVNAAALPNLFRSISSHLRSIFSATLYIGPARARSERYYRYQDLAVSEIDPDGKNFPMFLNSLRVSQVQEFSDWVRKLFGYGVSLSRSTGHISINLTNGGDETNIVDVGYGVSQILPVLGQIWWARNRVISRESRSPLSLLVIEQPELHLHPAHQALLADALVGDATASIERNNSAGRMHYVVETHSETLVNRLGEFIAAKRVDPSEVQVILFEPDDDGTTTKVRTVEYNSDGALIDWPYGFFQAPFLT
ncbi:AAA family ATPase [Rhizobium sp. WW_1]|uniref:AAA family ATPase n=1 Tax=Rhizobium sp. WW_1 TaxID=1907375 RepID=UPI001FDEE344|nr:AAA family ATPase [Rhizobium sp. WW_1]